MNESERMRVFHRVAELSSFTDAAESLGLPKATVSGAVRELESELGARLLERTTRRVRLTRDGFTFLERSRDVLHDWEELMGLFQTERSELEGRLRIDMPAGAARGIVLPRLPEFLEAHPKVTIEISCTDRFVDVVREGFDCVLRVGTSGDSSLVARRIGYYRIVNCVSPAYLVRHGRPETIEDLAHHRLIHYAPHFGSNGEFECVGADGETHLVPMDGRVAVNNSDAYLGACLAGLGIIQVPEVGVAHRIASGELVAILPDLLAEPMAVTILYPNRRHLPRRVRVFMEWLSSLIEPRTIEGGAPRRGAEQND